MAQDMDLLIEKANDVLNSDNPNHDIHSLVDVYTDIQARLVGNESEVSAEEKILEEKIIELTQSLAESNETFFYNLIDISKSMEQLERLFGYLN
ncbi:hypothetical protein N9N03_00785 [Chlamydiia bacterium]|nr:hypothetical protein [Chlamydiia bacterium]